MFRVKILLLHTYPLGKCELNYYNQQMGYSNLDQVTAGIHQRLWCRTFILANTLTGPRIALVTLDTQAGSQIMKIEVHGV